jgi:hypothetical protein
MKPDLPARMFKTLSSRKIFKSDWSVAGIILALFLLTNRYVLGWDDQHLEIPLLKSLIDPGLYAGDYYVESLKVNFSSYLYPLLARLISVEQIPAVYFTLYITARYFMFFWMFKIWTLLFGSRAVAFAAALNLFLVGRTEELIYRTFSHQEFAYAIIFAGIYAFYRGRFILAALLLGVAANFHFLYALFPMFYMMIYLAFFHNNRKWKQIAGSGAGFILAAIPFLAWAVPQALTKRVHAGPVPLENWIAVFKIACPYNFFFHTYPLSEALPAIGQGLLNAGYHSFIVILFIINWVYNPAFRADRKTLAVCSGAAFLLVACFYFSYVQPSRFALDLNLIRNFQYLQWVLGGYTVFTVIRKIRDRAPWQGFLFGLIFVSLALHNLVAVMVILLCAGLYEISLITRKGGPDPQAGRFVLFGSLGLLVLLTALTIPDLTPQAFLKLPRYLPVIILTGAVAGAITLFPRITKSAGWLFVIIPLIYMAGYFGHLTRVFGHRQKTGDGFWQLQREWEAVQHYVREHTPKDARLLVPYDMEMGGFRVFSERGIVASYRDCGIVGFDYPAVLEWQQRIADIAPFRVFSGENILPAVVSAVTKYNVDYIVFMRYYAPDTDNALVKKIYQNEVFSLFAVRR